MDFVVRNIASTAGLDGAFRIHLPPDAIQQAGLVFNELCRIAAEDGRTIGYGIVWRAAEKLGSAPKTKPARLTETMREAFGIKEGSVVTLTPHRAEILHADKVVLTDISTDHQTADNGVENRRWRGRCTTALYNADAIAVGTPFDITAKKGIKKRFVIESVSGGQSSQRGSPNLYYITDDTQIEIGSASDSMPPSPAFARDADRFSPLSADGIGGLAAQIEALNTSIKLTLKQTRTEVSANTARRQNWPVILHGYEGTGKSLLLSRTADTGFRTVVHLGPSTLDGTTTAKKRAIADRFNDARANQPSVVLIDNLQQLVPSGEDAPLADALCQGLDSISGLKVLVVAATRSLLEVNSEVLWRFVKEVELPIPDLKAREQILQALLGRSPAKLAPAITSIGSRTHGFTSRDLAKAVAVANMHALERSQSAGSSTVSNGMVSCDDTEPAEDHLDDEPAALEASTCDEHDWNFALSRVRPAALREILFTTPQISWSDIGGSQPIRARLDKVIGWPLHHADLMKQQKLSAKKGMLLYGPPGCSKTLTAQAVAATYSTNFIAIKGAELISMYVGESERAVREIFRKARTARPCIIFFDEIDSIASERETSGSGSKGLNVLTTLLNEMDGFESQGGVFVLAATNKPEALDPAIMRPGRFDQHLYLPPPGEVARREILDLHLAGQSKEDDLDISRLVRSTQGYTGAEVVAVCNLAKEEAFARLLDGHGGTIRMDDFERALLEIRPRVSRDMLAEYEAFASR